LFFLIKHLILPLLPLVYPKKKEEKTGTELTVPV